MGSILLILAVICYVVWPIDIVSDVIPILGWLDDVGVLGYLGCSLLSSSKS